MSSVLRSEKVARSENAEMLMAVIEVSLVVVKKAF